MPWRHNGQRALQVACVLLLFCLLVLTLWCLSKPPLLDHAKDGGINHANSAAQQIAIKEWQALWSAIEQYGEAAFLPKQLDTSLRAAGDTVFMRYRRLWYRVDGVNESVRRQFQMAALANLPQRKLALLQPLAASSHGQIKFRALLEMARVYLRLRALEKAQAVVQQALTIPDLNPKILADAYFVLGYSALEAHDFDSAETALAAAVKHDPGFWDARQVQLLVLAHQLSREQYSVAECLNRTRLMIANLGVLPALAQDRTQFRDIADRFAAPSAQVNPAFALLSGLGYLWAGERHKAQQVLQGIGGDMRGVLPRQCMTLLVDKAKELLSRHF